MDDERHQRDAKRMQRGTLRSPCGARLVTYAIGPTDAPPMVLSNGLGGNIDAWHHLVDYFADRYRILSWDYRGLFDSEPPPDPSGYDVEAHAADLHALLEAHAGGRKAILLGWSMGVQVNFELYRHHPEQVEAIVAINGTAGRPFRTAFRTDVLDAYVPWVTAWIQRHWHRARWAAPLLADSRLLFALLKRTGLLGSTADADTFFRLMRQYVHLDFGIYVEILRRLGEHDASDVLPHVRVPVLVVAGQRDRFTPVPVARRMAETIPHAELYLIPAATHYCALEFPELLNLRIDKFLHERVHRDWV